MTEVATRLESDNTRSVSLLSNSNDTSLLFECSNSLTFHTLEQQALLPCTCDLTADDVMHTLDEEFGVCGMEQAFDDVCF